MIRSKSVLSLLLCLLSACQARGQAGPPGPPVIAAAGDISCDPADPSFNGGDGTASACRMKATSDLLLGLGPTAVLLLGDNQYEDGAASKYQTSYDPAWGRLKAITRPVPGNHEYGTANAAGYFSYFGAAAGDPAKGYSSYDLGGWHLIALNSNCGAIGGCGAGSPQEQWLAADLAAHPGVCTLGYWHHPRFSSGPHGNDATYDAFWQDLYAAHADLVLNGHDHVYERFAPQTPAAAADPAHGIRQFTVGTGGKNLTSIVVVRANSEVRDASDFGVLELTLHSNGYAWRFLSAAGGAVLDQGTGLCHSARPWPSTDLYTLPPCRVVDTRNPAGAQGGPALASGTTRSFPIAGTCGVPAGAVAVVANVTAVSPTAAGSLEILPSGIEPAGTSTISFKTNQVRSNNVELALGAGGEIAVRTGLSATGTVHFVLDVSGYFQ
ncbi:MAG TPA: metallophosphoesterase [Thermoanaerobaculia bacterium]|nr:metallophosphoesterase [Thermoanaerobaculia bacterium]